MRVIIGAGKTAYEGWVSTQESELNLLDREEYYEVKNGKKEWKQHEYIRQIC